MPNSEKTTKSLPYLYQFIVYIRFKEVFFNMMQNEDIGSLFCEMDIKCLKGRFIDSLGCPKTYPIHQSLVKRRIKPDTKPICVLFQWICLCLGLLCSKY